MASVTHGIIHQPMKLVGKTLATPPPWSTPDVALRIRPGERPAWITLQARPAGLDDLRQAAQKHRLPVDVVAALLLEWAVCTAATRAVGITGLITAARRELDEPRLAPNDDLRAWERQLTGHGPDPTEDELPEVCLPARLTFRLPRVVLSASLDLDALDVAVTCEGAACRRGMSLETWVLRQALVD
jgi:hypothetical protein